MKLTPAGEWQRPSACISVVLWRLPAAAGMGALPHLRAPTASSSTPERGYSPFHSRASTAASLLVAFVVSAWLRSVTASRGLERNALVQIEGDPQVMCRVHRVCRQGRSMKGPDGGWPKSLAARKKASTFKPLVNQSTGCSSCAVLSQSPEEARASEQSVVFPCVPR